MQQNSGFENRHIDVFLYANDSIFDGNEIPLHYAPVFHQTDSDAFAVFPGTKVLPYPQTESMGAKLPFVNTAFPFLFLIAFIAFVVVKSRMKNSIGNIFLIGLYQKGMQETERRQIERNKPAVNGINAITFFLIALILYGFAVRFGDYYSLFNNIHVTETTFYVILFAFIIAAVFVLFYLRNFLIILLGRIFSAPKIMKEYQKPYKLLFTSMTPVLLFIAAFVLFAPYRLMQPSIIIIFFSIASCYLLYVIFSLLKISNNMSIYSIHIFLYLCTLEILPFLLIVKFLKSVCF